MINKGHLLWGLIHMVSGIGLLCYSSGAKEKTLLIIGITWAFLGFYQLIYGAAKGE